MFLRDALTWRSHAFGGLLATGVALLALRSGAGQWETGPGFRSRSLDVPASGRAFLQVLEPAATGVGFTNYISEEKGLENSLRTSGAGMAAGDVDGDGWCDLYFCGMENPNALYRNLGNWKFTNVTASAGLSGTNKYCTGATF